MRVAINYSVDVEKIPKEIYKLCREAFVIVENLPDVESDWDEAFDSKAYNKAYDILNEVRTQLVEVDARFADCNNILLDYQRILLAEKLENENRNDLEQLSFNFDSQNKNEEEVIDSE